MRFFRTAQQLQRSLVRRTFAHLAIKARHRFCVVIEDIRPRPEHDSQGVPITAKIGNQNFDFAARHAAANFFDGPRENMRAAVGLVVTVHRSHHRVTQSHFCHGFRYTKRLVLIRRAHRLAGRHSAEAARARADIPEDHESRGAMFPAFTHIRAARAFADGVQFERAHDALQVLISLPAEKFDAEPGRPRMRIPQWNRTRRQRLRIRQYVKGRGHGAYAKPLFYASRPYRTNCRENGRTVLSLFLWDRPSDGRRSENEGICARREGPLRLLW